MISREELGLALASLSSDRDGRGVSPPAAALGLECTMLPLTTRVFCPDMVAKVPVPFALRNKPPVEPVPRMVTRTVMVSPGLNITGIKVIDVCCDPVPWQPLQFCTSMPPLRAEATDAVTTTAKTRPRMTQPFCMYTVYGVHVAALVGLR